MSYYLNKFEKSVDVAASASHNAPKFKLTPGWTFSFFDHLLRQSVFENTRAPRAQEYISNYWCHSSNLTKLNTQAKIKWVMIASAERQTPLLLTSLSWVKRELCLSQRDLAWTVKGPPSLDMGALGASGTQVGIYVFTLKGFSSR